MGLGTEFSPGSHWSAWIPEGMVKRAAFLWTLVVVLVVAQRWEDTDAEPGNLTGPFEAVKEIDGWTPLQRAAITDQNDAVIALLSNGADAKAKDKTGWTPLFWAAFKGDHAMATSLIAVGADIKAQDTIGKSAKWWAALRGHHHLVSLLAGNPLLDPANEGADAARSLDAEDAEDNLQQGGAFRVSVAAHSVPSSDTVFTPHTSWPLTCVSLTGLLEGKSSTRNTEWPQHCESLQGLHADQDPKKENPAMRPFRAVFLPVQATIGGVGKCARWVRGLFSAKG